MGNSNLHAAKMAAFDEWFTRYSDIEKEINEYVEYNPDVFRDKTILLPCDDSEVSNFTKYFVANFDHFGIKKLISTSYAGSQANKVTTDFEANSPLYDAEKHDGHGKLFILERNENGDKTSANIVFKGYLEGDGDFASEEVTKLRDEADVLLTNPPFHHFRSFLAWVMQGNLEFIIVSNPNAVTYKEVFPLIKDGKIWLGSKPWSEEMYFEVPDEYRDWLVANKKEGSGYKIVNGRVLGRTASIWMTNLDFAKRHSKMQLDTAHNNLIFNKKLKKKLKESYNAEGHYPVYDNYDAIEVPYVDAIPSDYYEGYVIPHETLGRMDQDKIEFVLPDFEADSPIPLPAASADKIYVMKRNEDDLVVRVGCTKDELHDVLAGMGIGENEMDWCNGIMGTPITVLDSLNPDQFTILGLTTGRKEFGEEAWPSVRYENAVQHNTNGTTANGSKANTRATLRVDSTNDTYYTADNAEGKLVIAYARILIRRNVA